MKIIEKKIYPPTNTEKKEIHLEEVIESGRLTEPNTLPEGFRLREAVEEMKRLGRPLTEEEAKIFEKDL